MDDFKLIQTPPAQSTLPQAAVACGAISAAVCLALDYRDFERGDLDFDEVNQVGAYLYGVWVGLSTKSTDDNFCESFDLLSDIPAVKQYMTTKAKRIVILNGNVTSGPADEVVTVDKRADASSFVSLVNALRAMEEGDNASLVHNRYTYTLMRGADHFYLYDSHSRGPTARGEVWRCPKDPRRVVDWLCGSRLSAALRARTVGELEWQHAARRQYSMTIFTRSLPAKQDALGHGGGGAATAATAAWQAPGSYWGRSNGSSSSSSSSSSSHH